MKAFKFVLTDENGIHARPAGLLVKKAGEFSSQIKISKSGKEADAKRIFSVMGLGAKKGDTLSVSIDGADEEKAAKEIFEFLKNNL